jgi:hypothetical protein
LLYFIEAEAEIRAPARSGGDCAGNPASVAKIRANSEKPVDVTIVNPAFRVL